MGWRDQLRPATFRGAAFKVASHSADVAGRRVHTHEYPGRDNPYPEDLGRKTREFSIEAYVIGADYMAARDALIDACAKAGAGELIHPYLGTLSVACTGCQLRETSDEGRLARFSLSFVDAGDNSYPVASADTGTAVDIASTDAIAAVEGDFADTFSVDGRPGFVSDGAVDLVGKAANAILSMGGPSASSTSNIAAADLTSQAGQLVRTPATLAGRITGLVASTAGEAGTGRDRVNALTSLASFGDDIAPIPETTSTRIQQAANQQVTVALVRRTALIEAARSVPNVTFANQREAFDLRDELGGRLDGEMETASDPVYRGLANVRAAMVRDTNARAPGLAQVVSTTPKATEPCLVTAYRLYGDAGQADEIAARNRLRHPGFVPGGKTLEVLTRV